jgi:tRNA1Val (adenine37-N6)-methyltransferase
VIPLTHDSISLRGAGVVYITQPKKGARFTLDSLLLADFCRIKPHDRILEPGAGTGVISLLLAKKYPHARFVADEVEPLAYGLLCQNIKNNGLCDSIVSVDGDVNYLSRSIAPNAFDVIVANPPYVQVGTGRACPSIERQTARQDQAASINSWINLQTLLKTRGRYILVFPARRSVELMFSLSGKKLQPKRLRFAHPYHDKPASLVLIEAIKGTGAGLEILPPLIIHEQGGGYSEEMRKIYGLQ